MPNLPRSLHSGLMHMSGLLQDSFDEQNRSSNSLSNLPIVTDQNMWACNTAIQAEFLANSYVDSSGLQNHKLSTLSSNIDLLMIDVTTSSLNKLIQASNEAWITDCALQASNSIQTFMCNSTKCSEYSDELSTHLRNESEKIHESLNLTLNKVSVMAGMNDVFQTSNLAAFSKNAIIELKSNLDWATERISQFPDHKTVIWSSNTVSYANDALTILNAEVEIASNLVLNFANVSKTTWSCNIAITSFNLASAVDGLVKSAKFDLDYSSRLRHEHEKAMEDLNDVNVYASNAASYAINLESESWEADFDRLLQDDNYASQFMDRSRAINRDVTKGYVNVVQDTTHASNMSQQASGILLIASNVCVWTSNTLQSNAIQELLDYEFASNIANSANYNAFSVSNALGCFSDPFDFQLLNYGNYEKSLKQASNQSAEASNASSKSLELTTQIKDTFPAIWNMNFALSNAVTWCSNSLIKIDDYYVHASNAWVSAYIASHIVNEATVNLYNATQIVDFVSNKISTSE